MGELGAKFRTTREKKNISLDDVSHVTKISSRMLQAIEQERFDQLPGGVFNKGFIRAYAKHLGLDEEEAISEYLDCLRQAEADEQDVWEPQPPAAAAARRAAAPSKTARKRQPPTEDEELPDLHLPRAEDVPPARKLHLERPDSGIPWRILIVAAVVVVLVAILWTRRSHLQAAGPSAAKAAPVAPSQPAPVPASSQPAPQPSASHLAEKVSSRTPSSNQTSANNSATHPSATASLKPESNAEYKPPSASPATPPPAAKPVAVTLVIRAEEDSWISVTADGREVSHETLLAPANASFRASREIVARIGNAAGVSFVWNGQEIPAQGAEAEVKTFVFDASGMHVLTPIP